MNNYKRVVATGMGLCLVLICGALNALVMNDSSWLNYLVRPTMSPKIHSVIWLCIYLCTAMVFGEFFLTKNLKRHLWAPTLSQILNLIWCGVFFRLHNVTIPLIIMVLIVAINLFIVILSIKNTGIFAIFPSLMLFWYSYLLGTNIVIATCN